MAPSSRRIELSHVRVVDSLEDLLHAPFAGRCNAIVWPRSLAGDFDEVVRAVGPVQELVRLDEDALAALPVGAAGARAVATLRADLQALRDAGHEPELDCIASYRRDPDPVLPTDVHSFHVDSATAPTDTLLCCYSGTPGELLAREEAEPWIDVPRVRAALLDRYGGRDDEGFADYLREGHFDLHHRPLAHARPHSMGRGNLWRLAVEYPGSPVPACIHRAPTTRPGDAPRLLLIS